MKWVQPPCQLAPEGTFTIASFRPRCASETTKPTLSMRRTDSERWNDKPVILAIDVVLQHSYTTVS